MNDDSSDEVFDNSCVKFTQQDVNSMRDYLCNMYPVLRTKCAVHSCGEILVDKKQWIMGSQMSPTVTWTLMIAHTMRATKIICTSVS